MKHVAICRVLIFPAFSAQNKLWEILVGLRWKEIMWRQKMYSDGNLKAKEKRRRRHKRLTSDNFLCITWNYISWSQLPLSAPEIDRWIWKLMPKQLERVVFHVWVNKISIESVDRWSWEKVFRRNEDTTIHELLLKPFHNSPN